MGEELRDPGPAFLLRLELRALYPCACADNASCTHPDPQMTQAPRLCRAIQNHRGGYPTERTLCSWRLEEPGFPLTPLGHVAWVSRGGESASALTLSRLPIELVLPKRMRHNLSATEVSTGPGLGKQAAACQAGPWAAGLMGKVQQDGRTDSSDATPSLGYPEGRCFLLGRQDVARRAAWTGRVCACGTQQISGLLG